MAAARKAALPKEWRTFPARYGANRAYWYVPKGLAVSVESLKPRLEVLKEFRGDTTWRQCQQAYVGRLVELGISEASPGNEQEGAALARMLKQVFVTLGLAWVDGRDRVDLTTAGELFLSSDDPREVLSNQLSRFQFWNPCVDSNDHKAIRLHPIPFLGELLRNIEGRCISPVEYTLFVSRARVFDDVDTVVEQIEGFRSVSSEAKIEICNACDRYMLGGKKRSSIYNTIRLNRPYAAKMLALSNLVELSNDGGLFLKKGSIRGYRKYLRDYIRNGEYIEFENQKDWIAYFGDPKKQPTIDTALDHYLNKGDVDAAVSAKKKLTNSPKEIKEFRDMIVSEKAIEDYLSKNLAEIGGPIGATLSLVTRQHPTSVGPIDLLCRDTKSGEYVVVELKKGRSADKVYGQLSRYMGWVKRNMADGGSVRGVIVGRTIDAKLRAARDAHATRVDLVEFEMKIGASVIG